MPCHVQRVAVSIRLRGTLAHFLGKAKVYTWHCLSGGATRQGQRTRARVGRTELGGRRPEATMYNGHGAVYNLQKQHLKQQQPCRAVPEYYALRLWFHSLRPRYDLVPPSPTRNIV